MTDMTISSNLTMTSIELVQFINAERKEDSEFAFSTEYVELAHRSFMAKVPEVLGQGCAKFLADYQHPQNKQHYKIYRFPKREACLMAMSYSYSLQAKVFDRMSELEAKPQTAPAFAIPQTFADALRLAADQQETIQQQAAQLAIAAPKADFVDRYVASTSGNKGFRQVCKLLRAKEPEFRDFLKKESIMYELGREWVPYGNHLDAGRFVLRAGTSDISGHAYNTAKFTPKGINWVAGEWAKFNLPKESADNQ